VTGSFLDELRAIRKVAMAHEHRDIGVHGSQDLLVRCYPPTDPDVLMEYVGTFKVNGTLTIDQQRQLLIDCRAEVMRSIDGKIVPAHDEGGPLRFDAGDERWGDDVKTARDCVSKLFNLDVHPLALAGQCDQIIDWMQGIDTAIASRVEGKSESAEA
jgi:hypothetical protein